MALKISATRRARADQAQRIGQHVKLALHIAAGIDALHVRHVTDIGDDALRDEIGERGRRERARTQRQRDDRRLHGTRALVDERRIEIGRHVDAGGIDAPLHVDRGVIEVRVEFELHDDRGDAVFRRRRHLVEIIDAVDLIFDRFDDEPLHVERRCAGIRRRHHDDRERDVRLKTAADLKERRHAVDRKRDEQHCNDDRPLDGKPGQPHANDTPSLIRSRYARSATLVSSHAGVC